MSLQAVFDNFALLTDSPNGVQKLRGLILQLALKGKLVRQNPKDKPVSVLIKEITKVKEKLINDKKVKRIKNEPIKTDEIPFIAPSSWQWVRLSEVFDVRDGTHDSPKYFPIGIPLVTSKNLYNGYLDLRNVQRISDEDYKKISERSKVDRNDVLFAMIGSIGNPIIVETDEIFSIKNVALFKYYDLHLSDPRYLHYFLKLTSAEMREKSLGGVQSFVSLSFLRNYLFPLPPLEEQKRIVAKVDELMGLCDELEARQHQRRESRVRLNNATLAPFSNAASRTPDEFEQASVRLADNFVALNDSVETVGKLRSTILQLAVQGKLAPQDPNDEPASIVVERIKEKKAQGVRDSKIKKVEQLPSIKGDIAFALPNKWRWTRLAEVCELITKGSSPKWQGVNYVNEGEGVLFVTSENVGSYRMIFENRKYVEARFNDIEPRSILKRNDALMNIVGASIGRTALFDTDEIANINQAVCLIRVAEDSLLPYLLHFFNSETCIQMMFDKQVDNARANLSMGNIAKFPIPLPPLEEQKRIVAKANQLMELCDELETKLRQAEADSEKLMNAAVQHVLAAITERSTGILAGASA